METLFKDFRKINSLEKNGYVFFLSVILLFGCSSKDDAGCFTAEVDFTNLMAEYGCENTKNEMEIDLNDTYIIIQSQAQFDSLVTGTCTPTIDFETYSLIIGKKGLANGNVSIEYDLVGECLTNSLELTVTFNQNETTEAPNLTYHILAPKIEDEESLTVIINLE